MAGLPLPADGEGAFCVAPGLLRGWTDLECHVVVCRLSVILSAAKNLQGLERRQEVDSGTVGPGTEVRKRLDVAPWILRCAQNDIKARGLGWVTVNGIDRDVRVDRDALRGDETGMVSGPPQPSSIKGEGTT